jgi:hypothetical protein
MNKPSFAISLLAALIAVSCSTLREEPPSPANTPAPLVADFGENEVLAGLTYSSGDTGLRLATVNIAGGPSAPGQAGVVYLDGGERSWANIIVRSLPAKEAELSLGARVLFLSGWEGKTEADPESYRKGVWSYGLVTSLEELPAGFVGVEGNSYGLKLLRIPVLPGE